MKPEQEPGATLSRQFRKWDINRRREALATLLATREMSPTDVSTGMGTDPQLIDLADRMVESAVGYEALPLGICRGIVVDGTPLDVPLATEEPSVIAAVTYASGIVARHGGFRTSGGEPVTTGQVFLEKTGEDAVQTVLSAEPELRSTVAPILVNMERRGGGYLGMDARFFRETGLLRVQIHVDVRDAMGANIVNTSVEALRPVLENLTGGQCLMAILTNSAERRVGTAEFSVPASSFARAGMSGPEAARRIALAGRLAQEDPSRAVTHNKGVMNGVTALMLATGNDTRAVEAAVHSYAARSGKYRGVAEYWLAGDQLEGRIELPLPVGTVGGAAGIHPTSRLALAMLGFPGATRLASIAASVGLAQNLAAVFALVTEGIQRGHMALHNRRLHGGGETK